MCQGFKNILQDIFCFHRNKRLRRKKVMAKRKDQKKNCQIQIRIFNNMVVIGHRKLARFYQSHVTVHSCVSMIRLFGNI